MSLRFTYYRSSWQLSLLLTIATPVQAQLAATFKAATTFSTGAMSQPTCVAVADVNGDGHPDLLTGNAGTSSVGVLLGAGAGSFGAVTTYSTGAVSIPFGIAVADVNGDGHPDLLTANEGTSSVGVLLGTGTGSFGAVTTFSAGHLSMPRGLTVADVDGDGKLDVLTANYNSHTVGVLLGTGTGSFGTVTTLPVGNSSHPMAVATADVNEDGKLDVLTANGAGSAGVLLGRGKGAFRPAATFSIGTDTVPFGIAVADVNGDGQLDLLTANDQVGTIAVLLGDGTGSFQGPTKLLIGPYHHPDGVAVADVNKDGKPDLLVAIERGDTVGVLLGGAEDGFGPVAQFDAGLYSSPLSLAVADVNGDGKLDVVTANYHSHTVGVLLNTTPMQTPATASSSLPSRPPRLPLPPADSTAGRTELVLYPNPAPYGVATLAGAAPGQLVQVLDVLGRVVATTTANAEGTAALGRLSTGQYIVRAGQQSVRLTVN